MPAAVRPALEPEAASKFREAGRIAGAARRLGISMIRPEVRLRDVLETVESFIRDHGAGPAFPAQTSRNQVAAHYCSPPGDETRYQEGDVVKLDIGVEVDGYVADNAESVYLGDLPRYQNLVAASRAALDAAVAVAEPGVSVQALSAVMEQAITSMGFRPVSNLTGHGLARWQVHTAPQIPAVPDRYCREILEPGMVIAIEPFATTGRGPVYEQGRAEVFMIRKRPRKMKGLDPEAWQVIDAMNGLPFARRSFPQSLSPAAVESTLARLLRTGCLIPFPPLVDSDSAVRISQAEHSLIITDSGIEVITDLT
ncbi:MAG: type II methionyl aminopeptidase [Planctomycetota bacterium]|nr:MAG: type II methionyl aminopeptidase [Planctomycetota bacterium]